jgi:Tfp pilus assembly protein PilE
LMIALAILGILALIPIAIKFWRGRTAESSRP